MDKRLVKLIERAVRSGQTLFPLNAGWQWLHREYNIGIPHRTKLLVSERDKEELISLVKRSAGLDLRAASVGDLAGLTRSETLHQVCDEKWAGRSVSAGRLVLKALPEKPLRLNGTRLDLPCRSHLDIAVDAVASCEHAVILIIENYECFDRLDAIRWGLDQRHSDPLVVYRGDPRTRGSRAVLEFLHSRKLPVLAMVDLDPAGLVIAQALPGAIGIVAPEMDVLEALFERGNPALYHRQRPQAERAIHGGSHPALRCVFELIERHQKGLVQERWLHGDVTLRVHPFSASAAGRPA